MKEEHKNNGRGIFYGVIGVATLVVAIIGATFAYFTASGSVTNNITGNMANISFDLSVEKVVDPGATSGIIPMSNTMVETAVNNDTNDTCVDDNGNAVCQVYKVTVTNNSTAAMFVDGYIALAGGSGLNTDFTDYTNTPTTMRWAQVFKEGEGADSSSKYSTAGTQRLGTTQETVNYTTLDAPTTDTTNGTDGFNSSHILTDEGDILGTTMISGNSYDTVKTNFIRVSDHPDNDGSGTPSPDFTRASDFTSMLVLSQQLQPTGTMDETEDTVSLDTITYYFVVWLSETGNNQTAGATPDGGTTPNTSNENFFNGVVSFISAQGSEVTATFSGYTAVVSDKAATTGATTTTTEGP